MTEIKFRAWFKNSFWYFSMNEPWTDFSKDMHSKLCLNGVTFEQFTGLYDKKRNDAEVYEGDIYQWCGLSFPITIDDFHGYRFVFGQDRLCRAFIENGQYRGNIHENPELLK